ncbi:HNH endonuclease [Mycobacterium phage Llij]|uniref:HNH endonuclease domain protein n=4 Tax=Cheoctovirus TaxID=1623281 RepID=G1DU88_9CAUD|nr:HNH endonuclease [Mycobacterium phage Shauna1]YP_009955212.1 HNH endonuclease [Mycobacterium phage Burwell21]YP_655096.1 HNH endonuclease [Mycobacterium phage Llij]QIQ63798.1 HNH endonuclease [Mycobacterium phage Phanphagia]USH45196.1 HNH endonuclease [Mycobacterium phage Whatsapiecost]ABD58316.1 hypothetical protein PBI_LLIJ_100 [Mycobacterium phage Llij]AEJ93076.1 HNH endonuclease domain protein [Mycobacterium phage Shauna1]AXQ63092.1 HNH endonuclease [Mycobacterium phage Burwell21]
MTAVCEQCGSDFVRPARRGRRRLTCSDDCKRARNSRLQLDRDKRYREEHGAWREKRRMRSYPETCGVCGRTFDAKRKGQALCSVECQFAVRNRAAHEANRQSSIQRRLPVLYTGDGVVRATHRTWTSGLCASCGEWFVAGVRARYCSKRCAERARSERRRAREAGVTTSSRVRRREIFERDGYRCHLCGEMTDPTQQVPHPRAPTIDHVLPLSRGGSHEPANCRCACFLCNSVKSDRVGWSPRRMAS